MKKVILLGLMLGSISSVGYVQANDASDTVEAPVTQDFVYFVTTKVKPDQVLAFKKVVLPYAAETRLEEGNAAYIVHQSPEDPTVFETYEHWKSDEARATHLAYPHTVKFFATVKNFFEDGYPVRKKVIELR